MYVYHLIKSTLLIICRDILVDVKRDTLALQEIGKCYYLTFNFSCLFPACFDCDAQTVKHDIQCLDEQKTPATQDY